MTTLQKHLPNHDSEIGVEGTGAGVTRRYEIEGIWIRMFDDGHLVATLKTVPGYAARFIVAAKEIGYEEIHPNGGAPN